MTKVQQSTTVTNAGCEISQAADHSIFENVILYPFKRAHISNVISNTQKVFAILNIDNGEFLDYYKFK
ncbi:hypothetical protein [Alteribacillus bidgolensis]|uniref:hypothetical protein n=1 Tax=Alteribacillus bidgolensis TaxID=930129 RepID=UPI000B84466F|nr:hypothetical protein [Alteribacillus bidgolensis]